MFSFLGLATLLERVRLTFQNKISDIKNLFNFYGEKCVVGDKNRCKIMYTKVNWFGSPSYFGD